MSRLTFDESPQRVAPDSDTSWLRSLVWEKPSELSLSAVNSSRFAKLFRKNLQQRISRKKLSPTKLAQRFPQHEQIALSTYESVKSGHGLVRENSNGDSVAYLTQTVALLDALTRKAKDCSSAQFLTYLQQSYDETRTIAASASHVDSPLASLLAAEAAWLSSLIFVDIVGMKDRRKRARRLISKLLDDWTDTDGTPHADLLPILPEWLASLIRSTQSAEASGLRLWSSSDKERVQGLLKSTILMISPEGSLPFGDDVDLRSILREGAKVLRMSPDTPMCGLLKRLGRIGQRKQFARHSRLHKLDKASPPVIQSDWAKLTLLRDRWRPDADSIALTHQHVTPQIEWRAFGQSIFRGDWKLNIHIDGQPLEVTPDWDAVCWVSDSDVDYIELQWLTDLDIVLCRQVTLIRGNHQLIVADSVSTPKRKQSQIKLESTFPLSTTATVSFDRMSRECGIDDGELKVRCFPSALPMEPTAQATGSLDSSAGRLGIHHAGVGGVYAPILFDWHPKHRKALADWRNLTVTEDRRRLDTAEASAHRIRLGEDQLLIYRNLSGSKKMRAVLGYHHNHETAIGRFNTDGDFDPLVLVE